MSAFLLPLNVNTTKNIILGATITLATCFVWLLLFGVLLVAAAPTPAYAYTSSPGDVAHLYFYDNQVTCTNDRGSYSVNCPSSLANFSEGSSFTVIDGTSINRDITFTVTGVEDDLPDRYRLFLDPSPSYETPDANSDLIITDDGSSPPSEVYSQSDHGSYREATANGLGNGDFVQLLGSGLSATISHANAWVYRHGGTGTWEYTLYECVDGSYTSCSFVAHDSEISTNDVNEQITFSFDDVLLKTYRYYAFVLSSANGFGNTVRVYGSTDPDSWLTGSASDYFNGSSFSPSVSGGVADYYFSLYGSYVPPVAPTEFNAVTSFIPQTGFSTSTGYTTVGANYSIPQLDALSYFGYRIYNPSGIVVYDASTTPTIAGVYTISTSYNFDTTGVYTGHAYFSTGGWEVDQPPVQQIQVGVSTWTVDSSGAFTQNPATTSSSTLPSLTLDCGDGFAGSVCNLVARLVIPSSTSFDSVQASFNAVLVKAPFSFFTESQRVLFAFTSTNVSPTGGSLSITLFSHTFPVISTSTASSIGFNTTVINYLKFVMVTGLWISLAWFLYWRIASIFGV